MRAKKFLNALLLFKYKMPCWDYNEFPRNKSRFKQQLQFLNQLDREKLLLNIETLL